MDAGRDGPSRTADRGGRERAPARARRGARGRARRGPGARQRRRRRVAGARLLARPLAPRPERADAHARAPASSARLLRALSDRSRGRSSGSSAACAGSMSARLGRRSPSRTGSATWRSCSTRSRREGVDEVLVIDSGSRDRSREIARAAGVELLEIEPAEFAPRAHPQPRRASAPPGELICFLTQDATPCPGWLAAYREAFTLDERVGAAYGPHLPRPGHEPDDRARADRVLRGLLARRRAGRAARRRRHLPLERQRLLRARLLGGDPLPRRPLLRGPGVRRRPARGRLDARSTTPAPRSCTPTTTARSSSCAATSTSTAGCARRTGPRRAVRAPRRRSRRGAARSRADRRWMAERGMRPPSGTRWTARATVHHGGRRVFSALGSRPADARRAAAPAVAGGRAGRRAPSARDATAAVERPERPTRAAPGARGGVVAHRPCPPRSAIQRKLSARGLRRVARVWREGRRRCCEPVPGMSERERLRLAMVIPPFSRGSGGHNTLFQIFSRLERRGHVCSVWLSDYHGYAQRRLAGGPAPRHPRVLRAVRGARLQGLRRLAGRRRRDRDRLADRPSDARARQLPRARLRRQRPRARVLPGLDRARARARTPTATACTASPPARGCATC